MGDGFYLTRCRSTPDGPIRVLYGRLASTERDEMLPDARCARARSRREARDGGARDWDLVPIIDASGVGPRRRQPWTSFAGRQARRTRSDHRGTVERASGIAEARSDCGRIRDVAVDAAAYRGARRGTLRREVRDLLSLAHPAVDGLERAAPEWESPRVQRVSHRHLEGEEVANLKKIGARRRRIIVFIDELVLSAGPCRARTWAPQDEAPVLWHTFSWKQLPVIAGANFVCFYLQLFAGSTEASQVVGFLKALSATMGHKLLIVWDRLQARRLMLLRGYIGAQSGAIALEYLPRDAPELNPVKHIWAYLKFHSMSDFCAEHLGELKHHAGHRLCSKQCQRASIVAFRR